MPKWTAIVVHHSFTGDTELTESTAIKRFHTSYREGGTIISEEEYYTKKEEGISGLVSPWGDIGYHWLIERLSDGHPWLLQGRSMMMAGAHCIEQGMNRQAIGVCIVGNWDENPPPEDIYEKAADTVAWLCRMYRIPVERVFGHRDFATYKSCPGKHFNMDYFRERVSQYLNNSWAPPGKKNE